MARVNIDWNGERAFIALLDSFLEKILDFREKILNFAL